MNIRPNDQLRLGFSVNENRVYRATDHSRVLLQDVVLSRIEYQLSRAMQIRLITQYSIDTRDDLRDDARELVGPAAAEDQVVPLRRRRKMAQLPFEEVPANGGGVEDSFEGVDAAGLLPPG